MCVVKDEAAAAVLQAELESTLSRMEELSTRWTKKMDRGQLPRRVQVTVPLTKGALNVPLESAKSLRSGNIRQDEMETLMERSLDTMERLRTQVTAALQKVRS